MVSDTCSLAFFSETSELEDAFGRVKVSDEAVTHQQVDEDMRLYGTRPEPSDVGSIYDIDDNIRRTKPLSKHDAQHVEATIGRTATMPGLFEEAGPENQVLTAMDWHSGASPLEACLNQSAIPTVAATRDDNERTTPVELQIAQEIEEIKNFRSVHLTAVQQPNSLNGNLHSDKDFASLRQGAQSTIAISKTNFPSYPPTWHVVSLKPILTEQRLSKQEDVLAMECDRRCWTVIQRFGFNSPLIIQDNHHLKHFQMLSQNPYRLRQTQGLPKVRELELAASTVVGGR